MMLTVFLLAASRLATRHTMKPWMIWAKQENLTANPAAFVLVAGFEAGFSCLYATHSHDHSQPRP